MATATTPPPAQALADPQPTLAFTNFVEFAPLQRAVSCPGGYFSCEDRGSAFLGVCCRNGQLCALDGNNQAACCPQGNVCTGVAPSGTGAPAVSYVPNTYFPFPYVATSFSNSGACSAAVSQCNANYQACTADLAGANNGYGVTIVVPGGGGTTVAPTRPAVALPTATSVCQSLSREACHGLQGSQCTQTGTNNGFIIGTGNAARPTAACMAGVLAGVGFGLVGAQL
ncbi:uncharacterized protein B0I36DRAFT_249062 [Microdochium trichocladiopsis]|uniref:Gpi-anchored protein n=1 Tax=Microdochium trichocladiopsis TaxID=1682393 RepID=A0A9P8Y383_9PEZI|nr:uncharacterized protein B0I36DRAFT_249062 [Microdochium trichocladiopsis]KAH7026348.1 hypothetical protein B0I36DRAFT_249062 [Microdochium trichocladiopsis]